MKLKKLIATGMMGAVLSGVLATGALAANTSVVVDGNPTGAAFISQRDVFTYRCATSARA